MTTGSAARAVVVFGTYPGSDCPTCAPCHRNGNVLLVITNTHTHISGSVCMQCQSALCGVSVLPGPTRACAFPPLLGAIIPVIRPPHHRCAHARSCNVVRGPAAFAVWRAGDRAIPERICVNVESYHGVYLASRMLGASLTCRSAISSSGITTCTASPRGW